MLTISNETSIVDQQDHFKLMFEYHGAVMLLIDPDTQYIIDANAAASEFYGYSVSELRSMEITEIDTMTSEEIQKNILQVKERNANFFLATHKLENGEERNVEIRTSPFVYHGRTTLFAIINDITERKQREEVQHLKKHAFDISITANSIANVHGIIIQANNTFLRIWGYERFEDVVGHSISDFFLSNLEASTILTILDEGNNWSGDFTGKRRDGSLFMAQGYATTIRSRSGKIIGYQSAVLDITDRKETDDALRESEERYRQIFENSSEAILFANSDGEIYSANPEACRIFGRSEIDFRAIGGNGIVDVNDPRLPAAMEQRRTTGTYKGELNLVRADGTSFPASISISVYKNSNLEEKTCMIIRDIFA